MVEEEIVAEFEQLHKSASRSKTARLRDLYEHIESLKSRGFSHAKIVNAMKKHGLVFKNVRSFEVTLYRIKREREQAERLTLPPEIAPAVGSEELTKKEIGTIKGAKKSSIVIAPKVTRQTTQEELKAITRGHIDPNQFIDE